MNCPRCGKDNPNDSQFCNGCGSVLAPSLQPSTNPDRTSALKLILGILAGFVVLGIFAWNSGILKTSSETTSSTSSASQSQITLAKYNQLKDDMTYTEVIKILGKPGTEISSSSVGGIKTVMIQWEADSFGANMNAMFQNGKLVSKAQFGLK